MNITREEAEAVVDALGNADSEGQITVPALRFAKRLIEEFDLSEYDWLVATLDKESR